MIQSRLFSEMLENSVRTYHNRAVDTAQVFEELVALAKEMREAGKRGEELGSMMTRSRSTTRSKSTIAP